MGWSSGGDVMDGIIKAVRKHVPKGARKALYLDLIQVLEDLDWDTQQESLGQDPVFDEALRELHPDFNE